MSDQAAISVHDVSKTYRIYGNPFGRIKELMPWNKHPHHQAVHALTGVNFEVESGQCVGLIGGNGAGKSTLLKILTGTTFPDTGGYSIRGNVASLLELGAGFTMDFTGRENIYMNGAMMGISHREMRSRFDEILEFSELHEFIDAPLRTYSSGMICRLGFSVAVATDPDVLIIDEILSVGDMNFQRKCVERIYDYKKNGKTLFFCSHSLYDVRQICDDAIWLDRGTLRMQGDAVSVTNEYSTLQNQLSDDDGDLNADPDDFYRDQPHLVSATLIDLATGEPRARFQPGEGLGVRIHLRNGDTPKEITVGVAVMRRDKLILFSASTEMDKVPVNIDNEGFVTLLLPDLRILAGEYVLMCGVMDRHGFHRFHQLPTSENLIIEVAKEKDLGVLLHDHQWKVESRTATPGEAERKV
ncbi:MAG: ABC transporter ATP-binding protein [Planctomycetota bacterium]|nr:ABC transporter ATP-binding protein [Planctomycetota bacterium]